MAGTKNSKLSIYLLLLSLLATSLAIAQPQISEMHQVGDRVEVTVNNSSGFYGGAQPYILKIGGQEFSRSRYPDDGNTRTLIFSVPFKQFDQFKSGDQIFIGYGRVITAPISNGTSVSPYSSVDSNPRNQRGTFFLGFFDKQRLKK